MREALDLLKPILEDESVLKIVQNAKFDMVALARYGIALTAIDDPCLMSYALDAGRAEHLPAELAGRLLGYTCLTEKEVMGSGRNAVALDRVEVARATEYAGEETDIGLRLWMILKPRLAAESVTTVYETLERPLAPVLAEMERAGVKVERATLASLSLLLRPDHRPARGRDQGACRRGLQYRLAEAARRDPVRQDEPARRAAHQDRAPGAPMPRRSRSWRPKATSCRARCSTGGCSPSSRAPIPTRCPPISIPRPGRVHTSYALAATTTGRLSSQEPNLQNIPVRTAEGRAIRKAFVAEKGKKLISADYSQIELRVLAHMADTPTLRQAFADGLDIHAMTASEMFGVPIEGMDPGIRRRAKAINFGIVYGISSVGLAAQLGIGRSEAGAYIKTYFERFPGIRDYMEAMKAEARRTGLRQDAVRAEGALPRDQHQEPEPARQLRARGDQRADPGLCRRHHPPRHDPHGAGARRGRLIRAHADAGA